MAAEHVPPHSIPMGPLSPAAANVSRSGASPAGSASSAKRPKLAAPEPPKPPLQFDEVAGSLHEAGEPSEGIKAPVDKDAKKWAEVECVRPKLDGWLESFLEDMEDPPTVTQLAAALIQKVDDGGAGLGLAELKLLCWAAGETVSATKDVLARKLATKLVKHGLDVDATLASRRTSEEKVRYRRAAEARAEADDHELRARLRTWRAANADTSPAVLADRVTAKEKIVWPRYEEREKKLIAEFWPTLNVEGSGLVLEATWHPKLKPGRDEPSFNYVDGECFTRIEYWCVLTVDEILEDLCPLDSKHLRIVPKLVDGLFTQGMFNNLGNKLARAGSDGCGRVTANGKVCDIAFNSLAAGKEWLRKLEDECELGDGVHEWLGLGKVFVDSSDGTRAAMEVGQPVREDRKLLMDTLTRIAEGSFGPTTTTQSGKHSDKPRSPEPNDSTSDRTMLVAGGAPHELIFESYLLGRRWRFVATGGLWVMSSTLRGASVASRVPWIVMNHCGVANGAEVTYVCDGNFLGCVERVAANVRTFVADQIRQREAARA